MRNEMIFDWDDANIGHVAEHGVSTADAEDALYNAPLFLGDRTTGDEIRLVYVGVTDDGKHLVVSVMALADERTRVCTAFSASETLTRTYKGRSR
jgi:uncharacterized DUF497 family protein